jgi:hypothetical protein
MALLHAHEPATGSSSGKGGGDCDSVDQEQPTRWTTAGWLEVAAAIEKPVLSLNSEHGDRKDERAFTQAFRSSQLTVRARRLVLSIMRPL